MASYRHKEEMQNITSTPATQTLLEKAAGFYRGSLSEDENAFTFLRKSGLSDQHLLASFCVGCCTGQLTATLPSAASSPEVHSELTRLGVLGPDGTEALKGAVTMPILDSDRGVVGLVGISPDPGPDHLIGTGPLRIWNAPAAMVHADLIVASSAVEGLSLAAAGIPNIVAFIGTPGAQESELLVRLGVTSLAFATASEIASDYQKHVAGISCFLLSLPEGHTPSDLLRTSGPNVLADAVDKATRRAVGGKDSGHVKPLADGFQCSFSTRRYELRGIQKASRRLRAAVRAERQSRLHVDTVDLYSARARRSLSLDLCRFFEESKDVIDADMDRLIRLCERWAEQRPEFDDTKPQKMTDRDITEARAFGTSPALLDEILTDYRNCGLVGEESNKLLSYLAAISRKMADPISVLILSSSGAGKSALQDATLKFCPPEDVVKLTSMTGKALFYKGRKSLKHKILALEEESGAEGASYPLRALISAGELIIETTVKDLGSGQLTTVQNRVEGPTSVFITTTSPNTDPETRSRFFVTSVDESREQTRRILDFQRSRRTLRGHSSHVAQEVTVRKHRNFQRLLQRIVVVNPFAETLVYSDDRLQSRRDQPKLLNLIAAVAFLRQMTKMIHTLKDHGRKLSYIEVDEQDMQIADDLAGRVLRRSLDDLNPVSFELLGEIRRLVMSRIESVSADESARPDLREVAFTRRELREFCGWPHVRVRRYLVELVEMEFITVISGRAGSAYRYYLCADCASPGQPGHSWSAPGQQSESQQPLDTQELTSEQDGLS
jgi:DNA primase